MQTDNVIYRSTPPIRDTRLTEERLDIRNEQGFSMRLSEIAFDDLRLIWGHYTAPREQPLIVTHGKAAIVSHFRFSGLSTTTGKATWDICEKEYGIFYQEASEYEHHLAPTADKEGTFFEVEMSASFFEHLYTEESPFIASFSRNIAAGKEAWAGRNLRIAPQMRGIIQEMLQNSYAGHLKCLYLEAKVTELFLLEVQDFDRQGSAPGTWLKAPDIERLHEARAYIEAHYDTACSIIDLARKVGINQMKLKKGFRELFGTTVFGYLSDLRMEKARQLLLDEKMYVNEVADRIGYKHPHHFTVAFKKKFGILPSELK